MVLGSVLRVVRQSEPACTLLRTLWALGLASFYDRYQPLGKILRALRLGPALLCRPADQERHLSIHDDPDRSGVHRNAGSDLAHDRGWKLKSFPPDRPLVHHRLTAAGLGDDTLCPYRVGQRRNVRQEPYEGQGRPSNRGHCRTATLSLDRSCGQGATIWIDGVRPRSAY